MRKLLITLMMIATIGVAQAQTITVGNNVVTTGRHNIQVGGFSLQNGTFQAGNVKVRDVNRVDIGNHGVRVVDRNRDRVYVPYRYYRYNPRAVKATRNGRVRVYGL
jgi:hypothetical protein